MNRDEFDQALDRYGANFAHWPAALADQGKALAARDPGAAARLVEAIHLSALLAETVRPAPVDSAMIGRIVSRIATGHGPEPAMRPTGRLFAWAGAAMAVFLVAGFVLGLSLPYGNADEDTYSAILFGANFDAPLDNGGLL